MRIWVSGWILLSIILTACGPGGLFEDSSDRATRDAQNEIYVETIQYVETQVSTIEALQSTAQYVSQMSTQVIRLEVRNQALEATLQAAASGIRQPTAAAPEAAAAQPGQEGQAAPGVGSTPLFPAVGQVTATPTPPPVANTTGATYVDASTATGVSNDDGCALDNLQSFPSTEDEIYLVVEGRDIPPNVTFFTRWTPPNAAAFDTVSWTPDQGFDEICIWFFITPSDLPFAMGDWTVELIADGNSVVSRSFTIQ